MKRKSKAKGITLLEKMQSDTTKTALGDFAKDNLYGYTPPCRNARIANLTTTSLPAEIEMTAEDNETMHAAWRNVNYLTLQTRVAESEYRALLFQKIAQYKIDLERYSIVDLPQGRCKFVLKETIPAPEDGNGNKRA